MMKIGIECESIEGKQWGVGRIVSKLLEEIALRADLGGEFKFYLYFKSRIPDLPRGARRTGTRAARVWRWSRPELKQPVRRAIRQQA